MTHVPSEAALARAADLLSKAIEADDDVRHILAIRLRITAAVDRALAAPDAVEDAEWVEALRRAIGAPFLDAVSRRLDGTAIPGPWRRALVLPADVRDTLARAVVVERTYDLPLAILERVPDRTFADPGDLARRRDDLARVDAVTAAALTREDGERSAQTRRERRGPFARIAKPLTEADARALLETTAAAAWRNALVLNDARRRGPAALRERAEELRRRVDDRLGEIPSRRIRWERLTRSGPIVALDPE